MGAFKLKRFEELCRALLLDGTAVRRRAAVRLEELLASFDPAREYPYEFLYFRVMGFRPAGDVRETYEGADAQEDLLLLLRRVAESAPASADDAGEPVYLEEELARDLGVSRRTLRRWRRRGLVPRAWRFADGRRRMAVRQGVLDRFLEANRDLVDRSARFTKLTPGEAPRAVAAARRLVRSDGLGLTAVAQRVGAQLGRAPETIRLALKRHDRENAEAAVFAPPRGRLTGELRRRIWTDYRNDVPVGKLCSRYGRSRASIYRVINRERALRVLALSLSCHPEDGFADPGVDDELLGGELHEVLSALSQEGDVAPLRRNEERVLFRGLNYAKFRVLELREEIDPNRYVPSGVLNRVEDLLALAEAVRERVLALHLPLADRVAKQHSRTAADRQRQTPRAHAELGRLIDDFDYRGVARFGAYANLELMKRLGRLLADDEGQ